MTLSETDIRARIEDGSLTIERDEGPIRIEPSSVDLHLTDTLLTLETGEIVDVTDERTYPEPIESPSMVIPPLSFRLGAVQERIEIPADLVAYLWGRSSVGRLGLFVHNAGLIDAGFSGDIVLELVNAAPYPIRLQPGMRIVQMSIHHHTAPPETPYGPARGSKYNGQSGVTPSRLSDDFTCNEND